MFAAFLLSFFLSPIVGVIVIGLMSVDEAELRRREDAERGDGGLKKCAFCAEAIRADAVVCRFCDRDV